MSSRWKGSRIFEQTFDILSPCRNLNTVNGAPSAPTCSTCLNSSFTYALPPGVAHTHSRDPDHCFSANNFALFQDVVTDGDLAEGHAVFEVVAFVHLTLWNFASGTYTLQLKSWLQKATLFPNAMFQAWILAREVWVFNVFLLLISLFYSFIFGCHS